jgi:hypothetical protein
VGGLGRQDSIGQSRHFQRIGVHVQCICLCRACA